METPKISDSEKWNFKMEWCRKAGFSPCNDLYWELAEQAYTQRYFENSPDPDISLKKFQGNSHKKTFRKMQRSVIVPYFFFY